MLTTLRADPRLADVARERKLPLILMHMRGEPARCRKAFRAERAARRRKRPARRSPQGPPRGRRKNRRSYLTPVSAFGKSAAQNFELLQKLPQLARLGYPLLSARRERASSVRRLEAHPKTGDCGARRPRSPQASWVVRTSFGSMTSPKCRKSRASPMPVLIPAALGAGEARPDRNECHVVPSMSPAERAKFAQRSRRRLSRLDARCLRFLYPYLCPLRRSLGVSQNRCANDACDYREPLMRPWARSYSALMADRYGRRLPLMLDVLFYSLVEVLSGFAPSFRVS